MSKNSMLTPANRAFWQKRFLDARFSDVDLDYWNTIAFSPAKVHPRMLAKLGVQASTPLSQVCREPVLLAQTIINHRAPDHSTSVLDDLFLEHCMETNPLDECVCEASLQEKHELFQQGLIPQDYFFAAVSAEFLKSAAAKFGTREPEGTDHQDLQEVIRREQQWMYVFEDAQEFMVASLGRRRMNVISNMWYATEQSFGRKEVNNLPLKNYFQNIITSFQVHARKPKPQIFWKAEELSETPLTRHLMVGDSIPNDILAALDAGYDYAVLVHRDGELTEEEIEALPDNVLVVEDLMQLDEVLPEYIGW